MLIQQGDVLIFKVDALPSALKRVSKKQKQNRLVLAEGEATGHAHVIEDVGACDAYEDESGTLWLSVKEEVTVVHEEHKTVTLTPGNYKIGIVREVDPFEEEIRQVRD